MKLEINPGAKIWVLYHGPDCLDGLGARWAAFEKFGTSANYVPVQYGDPLPVELQGDDVSDCSVYILDFSYSKDVLERLASRVASLVVIDHHVSAQKALRDLDYAIFDLDRSGAVLAWEYFHPNREIPQLLLHIQDRDLWRFELPDTELIMLGFSLGKHDYEEWRVATAPETAQKALERLKGFGQTIQQFRNIQVVKAASEAQIIDLVLTSEARKDVYKVAVANTTTNMSEVGAQLYNNLDIDFSLTYFIKNKEAILSFRSKKNRTDVSEVATRLGGGGHENAAGARVTLEQLQSILEKSVIDL